MRRSSWLRRGVLLAATRRELGANEDNDDSTAAMSSLSADAVVAAAVVTSAPPEFGVPVFGTPDPFTGAVAGTVIASDPEGKTLTYKLVSRPAKGAFTFNARTATFTYTPTAAQRVLAAVTAGPDAHRECV